MLVARVRKEKQTDVIWKSNGERGVRMGWVGQRTGRIGRPPQQTAPWPRPPQLWPPHTAFTLIHLLPCPLQPALS